MSRWRVLIAGCGYVGSSLGLALAERGHRVWGLRRDPHLLPHPIIPLNADLTRPGELLDVPKALTHVVYAAAADGPDDEMYRKAYVLGLRHVLELPQLRQPAFRQMLLVSSTAVYGQVQGEWVDETSPTFPHGFAGERMLEAEAALSRSGLAHTILRCAGIYGPGRTRLIRMAKRRGSHSDGSRFTNRIHRDDVAGALLHLMDRPAIAELYLGVDHEPAPLDEVLAWLGERLEVEQPAALEQPALATTGKRSSSNKRCCNKKLRASGYRFRYPTYREGYATLLGSSPEVEPG